jgi:hypothetical protein
MNTKTAEFHLPVFKQGSDLRDNVERAKGSNYKGLLLYAKRLHSAATLCEALAVEVKGMRNVEIDADTSRISVIGPETWIDKLIEMGLLLDEAIEEEELS